MFSENRIAGIHHARKKQAFRGSMTRSRDWWTGALWRPARFPCGDRSYTVNRLLRRCRKWFGCVCGVQNDSDVVRNRVADACIGRAGNVAGSDHVPEGDSVVKQKLFFFCVRAWKRRPKNGGQHFPEPILRMSVVKTAFARFDGWKRTQNQNPG